MKEAENQPESFAISSLEYEDNNLEESEINHEALSLSSQPGNPTISHSTICQKYND